MKIICRAVAAAMIIVFCAVSAAESAADITRKCSMTPSTKTDFSKITDNQLLTYWTSMGKNGNIKISAPAGERLGALALEWFIRPKTFKIEEYDADRNLIRTTTQEDYPAILSNYIPLAENTVNVRLLVPDKTQISEIRLYSPGQPDSSVKVWKDTVDKADIMFIATHQDDELLWFGGGIPYYAVAMDCDTVVLYSTTCGRRRKDEALSGLWIMGVDNFPVFMNLKDTGNKSRDEVLKAWGGKKKVLGLFVEAIRKYRPEVIVTQDKNGEYGHMNHKLTSQAVIEAVKLAGDPSKYPESASKYGAWDVKKLYLHLGNENVIYMDWETHLSELDGFSPIELADMGFKMHETQQKRWNMEKGKEYDNTKFSLVYTAVGADVYKDDFLENTSADLRLNGKK